jgi:hypothetical protein
MDRIIAASPCPLKPHSNLPSLISNSTVGSSAAVHSIGLEIHTHLLCKRTGPLSGIWGGVAWLEPADKPHAPFSHKTQLPPSASPHLPIRFWKGSTRESPCSVGCAACLSRFRIRRWRVQRCLLPRVLASATWFLGPARLDIIFINLGTPSAHTPQIAAPPLQTPPAPFCLCAGHRRSPSGIANDFFVNRRLTVICARPEGGPRPQPLPW